MTPAVRPSAPSALHGSYVAEDVTFLLKPITAPATDVADKERLIQSGARHYSEMLSPEHAPSAEYMAIYAEILARNGPRLAQDINALAARLEARCRAAGPRGLAVVSLARAGTPIGVLLTRGLRRRGHAAQHYSISIIRGRGLDLNALRHILARHDAPDLVFVDGWTGKGAIAGELRGPNGTRALGVEPFLVVVADPAGRADLAAADDDYAIPSGLLNGIVSGLVSRSVLNEQIGAGDFHGCVLLDHLAPRDITRSFVDHIDGLALAAAPGSGPSWTCENASALRVRCQETLASITGAYRVGDINRIKPGIAEATRAVLRRLPDRLLLRDPDDPNVAHLVHLCAERKLPIDPLPAHSPYRAIAIIAPTGGD